MASYVENLVNDLLGAYPPAAAAVLLAILAVCAVAGYYVTLLLLKFVERLVAKTETTWDDDLINARMLRAVSQLTPALVVAWLLPQWFDLSGGMRWGYILTRFYIIWAVVHILCILSTNLYNALAIRPNLKAYAIKGVFQMINIIMICAGAIVGLSVIIGRSPLAIFTALGASAAVLMLVFRDTILGLVASVQLTANKMMHRGDWVECPKSGANGEVEDISLTTVKIRNWDNSVTTIPPYTLITDSFRNYQPMRTAGARRVARSIYIDFNTIGFPSPETLEALRERHLVGPGDTDIPGGCVNLQLLRRYLTRYLRNHPRVRTDLLLMVRQMEPTPSGLPVELYFFLDETRWAEFETLQSDIFEHVFAVIPRFGLRIFQAPAGADLAYRAKAGTKDA